MMSRGLLDLGGYRKSELQAAFADGWDIESITPTRFEVIPEFKEMFSEGGPKAWFVVVRRR